MRIGAVFPQTETGTDLADIACRADAHRTARYQHILIYDEVLGAGTRPERVGAAIPATIPSTRCSSCSDLSPLSRPSLNWSRVCWSFRNAMLVAKQAAEVDLPSRGRPRRSRSGCLERR